MRTTAQKKAVTANRLQMVSTATTKGGRKEIQVNPRYSPEVLDTPTTSVIPNTSNVPRVRGTGSRESTFKGDDFVVVNFEGQLFPGRVTEVKPEGYIVSTMERTKKNWRWPDREDAILYSKEEILYTIQSPKPVGKRGIFEVKDLD